MEQGILASKDLPIHNFINQKLLDCLPGIFYLYKIEPDGPKLKAWNRNHITVTGYSKRICKDKSPYFFIDDISLPAITKAINELIVTGEVRNVYGNLKTKKGEILPYIFEGYRFKEGAHDYFMGVGIDASKLLSLKEQLRMLELEKEQVLQEKRRKEEELIVLALRDGNSNKLLNDTSRKLESLLEVENVRDIHSKIKAHLETLKVQGKLEDNWDLFRVQFNRVYNRFFRRLKESHPTLTNGEIRYCTYIKVNLSQEQLCSLMHITKAGLKKKRYRIKKKLRLPLGKKLEAYISGF